MMTDAMVPLSLLVAKDPVAISAVLVCMAGASADDVGVPSWMHFYLVVAGAAVEDVVVASFYLLVADAAAAAGNGVSKQEHHNLDLFDLLIRFVDEVVAVILIYLAFVVGTWNQTYSPQHGFDVVEAELI